MLGGGDNLAGVKRCLESGNIYWLAEGKITSYKKSQSPAC